MELARMGGGGPERKLFLTVTGAEGEEEHVQEVCNMLDLAWSIGHFVFRTAHKPFIVRRQLSDISCKIRHL